MSEERNPDTEAAEAQALDIRAQMKAARRNITEAAARVLTPEARSFESDPDASPPRRRDS